MMCGYAGIAIILGKTLADWYRFRRIPVIIRTILPLLILVPSFICCQATVGLSMITRYAPRVWLDGFRSIPEWDSKGVETKQGKLKIWPDYLIASNRWPCASTADKKFFKKLFEGETQYRKQVQFDRLYFNKETLVWKYCLRFYKLHGRMSPRIMIYEK
jgi:hypothetical protein